MVSQAVRHTLIKIVVNNKLDVRGNLVSVEIFVTPLN